MKPKQPVRKLNSSDTSEESDDYSAPSRQCTRPQSPPPVSSSSSGAFPSSTSTTAVHTNYSNHGNAPVRDVLGRFTSRQAGRIGANRRPRFRTSSESSDDESPKPRNVKRRKLIKRKAVRKTDDSDSSPSSIKNNGGSDSSPKSSLKSRCQKPKQPVRKLNSSDTSEDSDDYSAPPRHVPGSSQRQLTPQDQVSSLKFEEDSPPSEEHVDKWIVGRFGQAAKVRELSFPEHIVLSSVTDRNKSSSIPCSFSLRNRDEPAKIRPPQQESTTMSEIGAYRPSPKNLQQLEENKEKTARKELAARKSAYCQKKAEEEKRRKEEQFWQEIGKEIDKNIVTSEK